jgi:bla regulator protein BlaR1
MQRHRYADSFLGSSLTLFSGLWGRQVAAVTLTAVIGIMNLVPGRAQSSAARPEFEVASVRPSAGSDGRIFVQLLPGGGLRISGATLNFLLTLAYEVRSFQISGGTGWVNSDRFDIVAKPDRSAGSEDAPSDPRQITEKQYQTMQEQMRPRLQVLLADRFQLRLHHETREEPVYALVVGTSGTKLQQSNSFRGVHIGRGQLTGSGATLEMLTAALAGQLGRPVLDRTGLKGVFDFKLEWTPDAAQAGGPSPPAVDAPSPADLNGPSIFTAMQEQLGLKLDSTKGPVEVLVIDHVEKPSEN